MKPFFPRLMIVLLAAILSACVATLPKDRSGFPEASKAAHNNILGEWVCDFPKYGIMELTYFPNEQGSLTATDLAVEGDDFKVVLDISFAFQWRVIAQSKNTTKMFTIAEKPETVVITIEIDGANHSRNQAARLAVAKNVHSQFPAGRLTSDTIVQDGNFMQFDTPKGVVKCTRNQET